MDITLNIAGGGVFSKIIQCGFQNLMDKSFDKCYFNSIDNRLSINPFDYIFRQQINNGESFTLKHKPPYTTNIPEEDRLKLKQITSKFDLHFDIINQYSEIQKTLMINHDYLGIHLRLTDMNNIHGNDYGHKTFEDYLHVIDSALKDYKKIYVASDNQESINKLISIYGNLITYGNFMRIAGENHDLYQWQINHLSEKKLWQDTFVDMLILAQCGGLIHRVSNFANAAKIYGNFSKIYNI